MQKLTIPKDELVQHKKYFNEKVVKKLKRMKKELRKKAFCSRKQWKFLSLCLYYKKQLAIGKPEQLRKIQKIIDEKYRDILEKNVGFKKELEEAFGYEKFCNADIGVHTLKKAKKKAGVPSRTRYDNSKVLEKLYYELEKNDVQLADGVRAKIEKWDGKKTKEVLANIIGETLIAFMTERSMSVNSLEEWNPYVMLVHRKLRTCPYCNRQYIIPFYSKSGKVRADLDHFYLKSKYPYFSMSIYNLVPSCKFCNTSLKGTKEFSLNEKTPYEISIDELSDFKYLQSSKVEFCIKDDVVDIYKKTFKIEELYKFHENIAEDLLNKHHEYPLKRIADMTGTGFISEKELYKLITGKISKREKILEEPLGKFKRDMVKDIFGEEILRLVEE